MQRRSVLLVLFRRPELTRALLAAVIAAKPDRVYVSVDGPRYEVQGEEEKVSEVVQAVQSAAWDCPVEFNYSATNLGAGHHVRDAISWFFSKEEAGIILEDDCIPSPDFFGFSWNNLRENTDPLTMSIGGYSPVPSRLLGSAPTRVSRYPLTWGWATWARAWEHYEFDLGDWRSKLDPSKLKEIGAGDPWFSTFWSKKFDSLTEGTRNIWDYQWVFAVWRQGGHGLLPRFNLVQNRGFGASSTHSFIQRKIYATPAVLLNSETEGCRVIDPLNLPADEYLHKHFYQVGYTYPATAAARTIARTAINRFLR